MRGFLYSGHAAWASINILPHSEAAWFGTTAFAVAFVTCIFSAHPTFSNNGYVAGFASAMNCVCMNNTVSWANKQVGMPFGCLLIVRTFFLSSGSWIFGKLRPEPVQLMPDNWDVRFRVMLRAASGFVCTISLFIAFSRAPVLIVLAVYYTNSIVSAVLGFLVLKEGLSRLEVLAMAVGLSSVFIIMRSCTHGPTPIEGSATFVGLVFAMVAAVSEAVSGVANRSLNGQVHYISLVFAQATLGVIMSVSMASAFPANFIFIPSTQEHVTVLVMIVISSFMVQFTTCQAYMLEKTGPLQVFMNAMVVVPQLLVDIAMGQKHAWSTWIGMAMLGLYIVLSWKAQSQRIVEKGDSGIDCSRSSCQQ